MLCAPGPFNCSGVSLNFGHSSETPKRATGTELRPVQTDVSTTFKRVLNHCLITGTGLTLVSIHSSILGLLIEKIKFGINDLYITMFLYTFATLFTTTVHYLLFVQPFFSAYSFLIYCSHFKHAHIFLSRLLRTLKRRES